MQSNRCRSPWVVAMVLLLPLAARGESVDRVFSKGEAQLAKGQLEAALESFAAAARADRNNAEYLQHYTMLRRIIDLRSRLPAETNPQRWENTARALRAFYASERIYPELLKLDQELHQRLATAETAALLAETQLATSHDADAVKTLSGLEQSKATPMTRALLGIALARHGRPDEARQVAAELKLPADAGPGLNYAAARLHAAVGDSAQALSRLKTCFEGTLPSLLEGFKLHAKGCPEFAALASGPEFTAVLETPSKMAESKCSGGRSCAGCPMSGKCPHSQGKSP